MGIQSESHKPLISPSLSSTSVQVNSLAVYMIITNSFTLPLTSLFSYMLVVYFGSVKKKLYTHYTAYSTLHSLHCLQCFTLITLLTVLNTHYTYCLQCFTLITLLTALYTHYTAFSVLHSLHCLQCFTLITHITFSVVKLSLFNMHYRAPREAIHRYDSMKYVTSQPHYSLKCHGVATENSLQLITTETFTNATANTQQGARLDIVANGVWGGPFERAYFDVRVFNPFAPSNNHSSIQATYRHHENIKKRHYERRIREVEHSSFTPLVFSTTGGLGPAADSFYKRLASMLADKWKQPYSSTMGWLRCRLSFSLLRSSIMCLRGARSSAHRFESSLASAVDLTISDSSLKL